MHIRLNLAELMEEYQSKEWVWSERKKSSFKNLLSIPVSQN